MQVACVQKGLCLLTELQSPNAPTHLSIKRRITCCHGNDRCTHVHCGLGREANCYRLGLEAIQSNLRSFQLHTCTHCHSTKANNIQHLSTYLACRKKPGLALQTASDILSKLLHPPLCTKTSLHSCSSKEFPCVYFFTFREEQFF